MRTYGWIVLWLGRETDYDRKSTAEEVARRLGPSAMVYRRTETLSKSATRRLTTSVR